MVMSEKGSHAFLPLCVKMLKIRPAQEALDAGGEEDRRPSPLKEHYDRIRLNLDELEEAGKVQADNYP